MKVIAFNGSPRKGWNTEQLLNEALRGARDAGAETVLMQLYMQEYKGCISCFACKRKNSVTNGLCAYKDKLRGVLEEGLTADVVIVGSPVYYDYPTAQTRAFLERFLFPLDTYMIDEKTQERLRILDKCIPSAMIYTMNCPEELMKEIGYPKILGSNEQAMQRILGYCETLYSCDTYQYKNYDQYDCNMFDEKKKAAHRAQQFPEDCRKAYELGKRLTEMAISINCRHE